MKHVLIVHSNCDILSQYLSKLSEDDWCVTVTSHPNAVLWFLEDADSPSIDALILSTDNMLLYRKLRSRLTDDNRDAPEYLPEVLLLDSSDTALSMETTATLDALDINWMIRVAPMAWDEPACVLDKLLRGEDA